MHLIMKALYLSLTLLTLWSTYDLSYLTPEPIYPSSTATGSILDSTYSGPHLFKQYCSSCHGANARVFVDRKWKAGSDSASITRSIKKGLPKQGMPAFEGALEDRQIDSLTSYILNGIADRDTYGEEIVETPKYYQEEDYQLVIDTVSMAAAIPWGIKVDEGGTCYFTDKSGSVYVQAPGQEAVRIEGIPPVWDFGQGGLLDIALHPAFEDNNIIYLSYSKKAVNEDKGTTALVMGRLDGDRLSDVKDIFVAEPYVDTRYHFGSRIVFDDDGHLYISVGDRGKRDDHPQYLTNSCGKIHRLNLDGTVPADNPFVGKDGSIPSIWSYGHRNPQGLVYDSQRGELWEHEHGPRGGDELNLVIPGQNYGWPTVSYGINYNGTTFTDKTSAPDMVDARRTWVPSIAPSGMAIVRGPQFSQWEGDILTGSLRFDYISRIRLDSVGQVIHEERILEGIGRVRSIEMGADGYLYVGVEEPGRILRISAQ